MTQYAYSTVIFDLDGTLIDSAPDLHAATNHTLNHMGRPPVELRDVRHMVGHGARKMIELGLRATGGQDNIDIDGLMPTFLDYYLANISNHTKPFDGVLDMLETLNSDGLKVGLCTNKSIGLTLPLLEELGLQNYFQAISGGDSFDFKKPDGRHITHTAKQMKASGPIMMVGDSINDVAAAKDANLDSIAVSFGYTDIPAHDLGATYLIDHINEIVPILKA